MNREMEDIRIEVYLGGESHAARHEQTTAGYSCRHHAEFGFFDKFDQILHLFAERWVLEVLLGIRVCGLIAGVCVAKRHFVGSCTQILPGMKM